MVQSFETDGSVLPADSVSLGTQSTKSITFSYSNQLLIDKVIFHFVI